MTAIRITSALVLGAWGLGLFTPAGVHAQDRPKTAAAPEGQASAKADQGHQAFQSLEELNAHYAQQMTELDRRQIADLTALASRQTGNQAELTYQQLFRLAVARDLYDAAAKAAQDYTASDQPNPNTRALATFIDIIAKADRGQYDAALQDLQAFVKRSLASNARADQKLDPDTFFAVGESFLQRLVQSGRYDVARKVCALFSDYPDPVIKGHYASTLGRIDMLGKPAPPIQGTDVDGKKVNLADHKGKVVLVDFWATWAPACVTQIPDFKNLLSEYGDQGFEILGVNLDGMRQGINPSGVLPMVRRFLVSFRVTWPNLLNGRDQGDFTRAYGVTEIPADFLIGRDGKILSVDLSRTELEKAIAKALGGQSGRQ
jgi:thiol-disulfide isomerase/thioredoxin